MKCLPGPRWLVVIVATPTLIVAVPSSVVPSTKLTVPVAALGVAVAVRVTVLRNSGVFGAIVGAVVNTRFVRGVPAFVFTVWLRGEAEESLPMKFWSPA